MFNFLSGCPSPGPTFSGSPTVQPGVVRVSWTAAGSSDPLVTGIRYALYSQCGAQTTFQLIDDDIQGLSYNITTLPTLTQCVLRVVVYSDHCLLNLIGPTATTTDAFTTGESVGLNMINTITHLGLLYILMYHYDICTCVLSFRSSIDYDLLFNVSFVFFTQCVQSMSMWEELQRHVNLVQQ